MIRHLKYDMGVVGGGIAGVSAAIGAAKAGCKVALLEQNPFLGGTATLPDKGKRIYASKKGRGLCVCAIT